MKYKSISEVFAVFKNDRIVPLMLGLNDNTGYMDPVNLNTLKQPYLYFGFLPIAEARNINVQGIKVGYVMTVASASARISKLN